MASDHPPPPIYSQQNPDEQADTLSPLSDSPQILIIPSADSINFQKGYLGADGERAAIEGELQVKGVDPATCDKVTVALRTIETAYDREIELGTSEVVLFSQSLTPRVTLPSSFPFAIPLMPDAPQSIHTPHSSLSHILTATLHSSDPSMPSRSKSITVHTRRYTSHSHSLPISPETHSLGDPTRVEVEVPRTTFKAGEAIPLYVTIPPPKRELVVDQGLRLRNVRAELVRIVKVKREQDEDDTSDTETAEGRVSNGDPPPVAGTSTVLDGPSMSGKAPKSPIFLGSSYRTAIARSGASCRFHSSKPVQLRFVLHQPSPYGSPADFQMGLPGIEYTHLDSDAECASVTQTTLLHSISFKLNINVSFVDMSTRTERFATVIIPVIIVAPPAPLPEVDESTDVAYQKKHDRPPVKTVRHDEDLSAPHYEGEAGPSALPGGAPPPFEERDAPPPFFSSAAETSTSTRLPTFLEAETEIIVPSNDPSLAHPAQSPPSITGEGTVFGFPASEQFDGHSDDMLRSATPPPTLEMATRDTNLMELTDIRGADGAIEALGLALNQHEENVRGELPPPPPPAMDDPSDPPPSIDSEFMSPVPSRHSPPPRSPPPPHSSYPSEPPRLRAPTPTPTSTPAPSSRGTAPPPYLVPGNAAHQEHDEHVIRPPPYMDLLPPSSD